MFLEDKSCPDCGQYNVLYYANPDIGIDCEYCYKTITWQQFGFPSDYDPWVKDDEG
jgi:ribosomal protein S27E